MRPRLCLPVATGDVSSDFPWDGGGQDCAGQGRGGNWRLVVWPGVMQAKVVAARRTVPMGIVSAKNKAARGGWLLPSRVS